MLRSIGTMPQALTELRDSDDGVGGERLGIEFRMVNLHLADISPGPLGRRVLEVGLKVSESRLECTDLATEAIFYSFDRGSRSASVVMQEHKGDVIPVLGFTPRKRGGGLGKQETGKS